MQAAANVHDFIRKWQPGAPAHALNERAGAQAQFIDLCRVLGVPEPGDPENYCFERGVTKTGSASARTDGFADVWLRGHFAWEYKAPGKNLEGALKQLMMYALPLENPPLLVVSDRQVIEVHTHFTGTPSERHRFALEELTDPAVQHKLLALWQEPERYKPRRTNREITEEAARTFAGSAERLRAAGVPQPQASHFLSQCVFCFFAEDVGLLPGRHFERLVGVPVPPATLRSQLQALFVAMKDGGLFGVDAVPWFNGDLFAAIDVPPLAEADVAASLFEAPFAHVQSFMKPARALSYRKSYRERGWLHAEPTPRMRSRVAPLDSLRGHADGCQVPAFRVARSHGVA